MAYMNPSIFDEIENLKKSGNYDKALKLANSILVKDPSNEDALLQIADIQYMKGEIASAEKPIDFILRKKGGNDAIPLYVKGVLEMEKTNWTEARICLRKALDLTNFENPEIVRCYGLCEYWGGNREKGIDFLEKAFEISKFDAEIIFNLIEIYLLEKRYPEAQKLIEYYYKKSSEMQYFSKEKEFYDERIGLFRDYLKNL